MVFPKVNVFSWELFGKQSPDMISIESIVLKKITFDHHGDYLIDDHPVRYLHNGRNNYYVFIWEI